MQEQIGMHNGDKCVTLTPDEWSHGFKLYTFKITDGTIGSGVDGPQTKSTTGSARLEVGFSAAQNTNIKVIVMYRMLGVIEIDQFRNIIVYYETTTTRKKMNGGKKNSMMTRITVWPRGC